MLLETGSTASYPGVILMTWLSSAAKRFLRDEAGASIAEYALLVALITIVCFAALSVFGTKVSSLFSASANSI